MEPAAATQQLQCLLGDRSVSWHVVLLHRGETALLFAPAQHNITEETQTPSVITDVLHLEQEPSETIASPRKKISFHDIH